MTQICSSTGVVTYTPDTMTDFDEHSIIDADEFRIHEPDLNELQIDWTVPGPEPLLEVIAVELEPYIVDVNDNPHESAALRQSIALIQRVAYRVYGEKLKQELDSNPDIENFIIGEKMDDPVYMAGVRAEIVDTLLTNRTEVAQLKGAMREQVRAELRAEILTEIEATPSFFNTSVKTEILDKALEMRECRLCKLEASQNAELKRKEVEIARREADVASSLASISVTPRAEETRASGQWNQRAPETARPAKAVRCPGEPKKPKTVYNIYCDLTKAAEKSASGLSGSELIKHLTLKYKTDKTARAEMFIQAENQAKALKAEYNQAVRRFNPVEQAVKVAERKKPKTVYNIYCDQRKAAIRSSNPGLTATEILKLVTQEYKRDKGGREVTYLRAEIEAERLKTAYEGEFFVDDDSDDDEDNIPLGRVGRPTASSHESQRQVEDSEDDEPLGSAPAPSPKYRKVSPKRMHQYQSFSKQMHKVMKKNKVPLKERRNIISNTWKKMRSDDPVFENIADDVASRIEKEADSIWAENYPPASLPSSGTPRKVRWEDDKDGSEPEPDNQSEKRGKFRAVLDRLIASRKSVEKG